MNSIALKITFVLELMDRYLRTYELKAKGFNVEIGIRYNPKTIHINF